ncbi:VOC family protein [Cohnella sp. WQ 127256]|uniref:VOC family protein n=1 Tax=Cohnella sp. WQ 127256 TaxID=2938790 RepID=UPI002118AF2D|nr:VOC family protein [Cohnella sp. WQ 127256]
MRIQEIKLLTNDLEPLIDFYHRGLELPLIENTESSVSFRIGSSRLVFERSEEAANPYYHFAINISESKIDLALVWLKEKGVRINLAFGEEVFFSQTWNSHAIYFYDPAGNIVELIARHNKKSTTGHEFTRDDMINISEIGMPAEDVLSLSEYLLKQYNEQVYISGDSMFTPIGAEDGLLILSSLERIWLGSNKKVAIFPMSIILESRESTETKQVLHYPYLIS